MRLVRANRMLAAVSLATPVVAAAMGVGSCTFINEFGDVKLAGDSGSDATTVIDSGSSIDAGHPDAASVDATTGDSGALDSGPVDKGVIVISGRVSDDAGNLTGVLTAIDPTTGVELPNAREMLNVPVVLFDGLRDLWLVVETDGTSLFPAPTDHAVLHTRKLDPVTGTWTTLQSLQIPPPIFGLAAVLTNRFVYLGFDTQPDAQSSATFITVDTTMPTAPNIFGSTPLPAQPEGLMATRSTTGNGGVVNMLVSVPCPADGGAADDAGSDAAAGGIGGGQCLATQHVTVPTSSDPATVGFTTQLGPFFGKPAFGSYLTGGPEDVIAWSVPGGNPSSPGPTLIHTFVPLTGKEMGDPIPFQTSDGFFQPFAFAECQKQALLIATNEDLSAYAIPLASSGMLARASTTHSGQSIYFEPYTGTVLAPFTQGDGFELTAFLLGGTQANPTLTPRQSGWTPPADVRPEVIAVRSMVPVACPP
jgi:hypothetical protein